MNSKNNIFQSQCGRWLNVGALRHRLYYKPLAILMAILLAPAVSWMEPGGTASGARPFLADAQATSGCTPGSLGTPGQPGYLANPIIQNYCDANGHLVTDLVQLESDALAGYLSAHNLPSTDASLIYSYGRQDLRDGVRAVMNAILSGIIAESPSSRSTHEQALFNWLQSLVWQNEISLYQLAIGQYNAFLGNPCTFTLDPNIAKANKLAYDGTPFCFGGLPSSIFGAPVPAESYFTTYGLIHAYTAASQTNPSYTLTFADTQLSTGAIYGIGFAGSAAVGAAISIPLAISFAAQTGLVVDVGGILSSGSIAAFAGGAVGAAAGIAAAPVLCVLIGIVAAFELFEDQKTLNELNGLSAILTQVQNTPPDLVAFSNDTSGVGPFKLLNTLITATVPEAPSTTALPVHQSTDLNFSITPKSTGTALVSSTLQYQDWNNNNWTAQTYGGWIVRTCTNNPSNTSTGCIVNSSITADLRYVDWNGVQWTASVEGSKFVSTQATPPSSALPCPADEVAGITMGVSNLTQCISQTSSSLQMLDENGNPITVSLTALTQPSFVVPGTLSFSPGTPSTLTVTATGNPAPTITYDSGLSGSGITYSTPTGASFPLTFNGSLTAPTGSYTLQLTASNSIGSVTQSFPVGVSESLAIVSPSTITATAGQPFSFTVVATGNPTPSLSLNPAGYPDLSGLSFKDNGNGTGTFSGTYDGIFLEQSCAANCGGFVATNSQGTVAQIFSLNFSPSPRATMAPPARATFNAGIKNSVLLSSYGGITPVSWLYQADSNAPWLTLTDNGNGTATLSGTPPSGTSATFQPLLAPSAAGSGLAGLESFPVTVVDTPVFTSANTATFNVGSQGSFIIAATSGNIATSSTLPQGLSFAGGTGHANIEGIPAVGTGGQYNLTLNDSGSTGSATQSLQLNVNEEPSFSSPNLAVLFAGQPASLAVTALGYPTVSNHVIIGNPGAPNSPSLGNGMYFLTPGLPNFFSASNLNSEGLATGTLTISGTPTSSNTGTYKAGIIAQNGVGTSVEQSLTLEVLPYNPTAAVNLLGVWTLARDSSHDVIATVVIANSGSAAAQNVTIKSATIGSVSGTATPSEVATIPAASTATFSILFPAGSIGTSGTGGVLSIAGAYSGGTFSNAGRIVLP